MRHPSPARAAGKMPKGLVHWALEVLVPLTLLFFLIRGCVG